MKILKNRKALSPVVASIILIAVTVAVSIAVAAWMGALTFNFMGIRTNEISKCTWSWTRQNIRFEHKNTGTNGTLTITQVLVNYASSGVTQPTVLPYILKASASVTLTVGYTYKTERTMTCQSYHRAATSTLTASLAA